MKAIQYIDQPNLILPLAASYNTRGATGFTQALTNASDQRKVNCVYEPITNAGTKKTTIYLVKRPGVVDAGTTLGASGQVAYLHAPYPTGIDTASQFIIFNTSSGSTRASMNNSTTVIEGGSATPSYVDRTAISGTENIVIQTRLSAGANSNVYFSNSPQGPYTQITSATFPLGTRGKMEHLDGYALISTNDKVYNSDLNSLANWTATNFISRKAKQDQGIGLARLNSIIISFGSASMEVFRNAGNAVGSPLESVQSMFQPYGLAKVTVVGMRHYYAQLGQRIYWKGQNPAGVFAFDGNSVEKVSTPAIDNILNEAQHYYVSAIGFGGKKAISIGLDLPAATTQRALLFFPDWNDWFEWSSAVFIPQASSRIEDLFLGVGANQHKLYQMTTSTKNYRDDGADYTMTHQFKLPTSGNPHQQLRMLGVKGDTAASTTTSALTVRLSRDDWQTSSVAGSIDMTKSRKRLTRLGGFEDLGIYLDHTGNLDCRLEQILARVE